MRDGLLPGSHKRMTSREQIISEGQRFIHERRRADQKRKVELVHQRELHDRQLEEEATQKKFSRWRFEPKLCMKSKDVASSTMPITSSTCS